MKTFRFFLATISITLFVSCNSQPVKTESGTETGTETDITQSDNIEAYYFHFTARCVTCRTIEESTKENLETLYPSQVKYGLINFQSFNLDEESTKPIAEKLGVTGQTLLFVKGDQMINLTNEGFLYAVANPLKFKEIINDKVAGLLISQ